MIQFEHNIMAKANEDLPYWILEKDGDRVIAWASRPDAPLSSGQRRVRAPSQRLAAGMWTE